MCPGTQLRSHTPTHPDRPRARAPAHHHYFRVRHAHPSHRARAALRNARDEWVPGGRAPAVLVLPPGPAARVLVCRTTHSVARGVAHIRRHVIAVHRAACGAHQACSAVRRGQHDQARLVDKCRKRARAHALHPARRGAPADARPP